MEALTAQEALEELLAGNRRFVEGRTTHPHQGEDRRGLAVRGQHPFAVILGCSDSRVPIEVIFDQGVGDLFVIRVAGNVVNRLVLGSVEFAAVYLEVPLVVVLGHSHCGAVQAAIGGGDIPGHVSGVVQAIKPAVDRARGQPGDLHENAVRANVERSVQKLTTSRPVLSDLVRQGRLTIVGARYDLGSGLVRVTS